MIILGIDPGTATTGYGLVRIPSETKKKGTYFDIIEYGCMVTSAEETMGDRLKKLYREMKILLKTHAPDIIAIERLFFFSNAKTVISVGQARGVVMLAAAEKGVQIFEYAPLQIKLELVGYGRAKKPEVQKRVKEILGVSQLKLKAGNKFTDGHHLDDAVDALAVAICHVYKQDITIQKPKAHPEIEKVRARIKQQKKTAEKIKKKQKRS